MDDKTIKQIQEALTPIAEKIGQGAQYAWEVVVRQQYVYAWEGVMFAILGLIGLCTTWILVWKFWDRDEYYPNNFGQVLCLVFGTILSGVSLVAGADTAITHFLNPDYYALQFFISLGQSAVH